MEQEINKKLDDILEIVTFVKDNAATRQEFNELRKEMNERFDRIDADIRAMRAEISDLKIRLTALEKRTVEDADVFVRELFDVKKRIDGLEKQKTILQPA